jgi:membrane dipeptidase
MDTPAAAAGTSIEDLYNGAVIIDGLAGDLNPGQVSQHDAGLTAGNITIAAPHADFRQTVNAVYQHLTILEGLPDQLALVRTAEDIRRCKAEGKFGLIFGLQDGSGLESDLTLLTIFHALGIRVMTLTYNERNALGDGCLEPHDAGITHFGVQVVREMNRLGIVLDLSHVSERTSLDAMKYATKPPVFSHSNPKALTPSQRCITDDQIRACGELGGLVGISVFSPMVWNTDGVRPTLDDFLDRMEYVINLIGVDHVGVGSDIFASKNAIFWRATTKRRYPEMIGAFDRDTIRVKGYDNHHELKNVATGLRARGYGDADILKVMGGNWMRIFTENFG